MLELFRKNRKAIILFFVSADIILISLSVFLAFFLRFDYAIPEESINPLGQAVVLSLLFYVPVFYFFGLYSFSWSYVSTKELVSLFVSAALSFLFVSAAIFFSSSYFRFKGFPRSTLFISFFLIVLLCGAIRIAKRVYLQLIAGRGAERTEKTLIIGAGDAGEQILRSMQGSSGFYEPIGFVDDSPAKKGVSIHGLRVLGRIKDIPRLGLKDVTVIVALPSAGEEAIKRAVEFSRKAGIKKIKILPSLSELVNEQVSLSDIRDFKIEDLLQRNPVLCDVSSVREFLRNKTVLITGAAGSIGSELSRQAAGFGPLKLLLLDQDETGIFNIEKQVKGHGFENVVSFVADIRDKDKINYVFSRHSPDIVFHAAAYKHVPLMESEPEEAVKNNIFGTQVLIKSALRNNVDKFIFISTDKAVKPTSVMGASKRIGEMICQVENQLGRTKFISVRFGNVLGSRGSVIPVFGEQIKKGRSLQVTHEDMKRYFMVIPEAVSLVLQAGQMGRGGEVFVLNMGNPVRILDLAKAVIRFSGLEPDKDIPIVFTGPRPGEKMSEELLGEKEEKAENSSQNIFTAISPLPEREKIENVLSLLEQSVAENKKEEIKKILTDAAN